MTIDISNNNPRISYSVASGVTQTTFAVPFEFFDDSDLNVYVDGILKTITSDYTVTGGEGSTGTITMSVTGAASGSTVSLTRDTTIERVTDFTAGVDINRAALNTQLDTLTAISADVKDLAERAIRVDDLEVAPNLVLPSIADRAGKLMAFDTEGGVSVASDEALGNIVIGANYITDSFTGDGSTTAFTLSVAANSKNNTQVHVDGVYQNKATYSLYTSTLTFSEAPPLNASIEVVSGDSISEGLTTNASSVGYNQGGTDTTVQLALDSLFSETVNNKYDTVALLLADTADGTFFNTGDYVTVVEGGFVYKVVASGGDLTNSGGVQFELQPSSFVSPDMFGAARTDRTLFQTVLDYSALNQLPLVLGNGITMNGDIVFDSGADVRDGRIDFNYWSSTGSLGKSVDPNSSSVGSIKSDMRFSNITLDGSAYPVLTEFAVEAGGTTTTVVLPSTASAVDNFYKGHIIQVMDGAAVTDWSFVGSYVGATRTLTLNKALSVALTAGDTIKYGHNDNLLSLIAGVSDVVVDGCTFQNLDGFEMVPSAGGGKGFAFDTGITNGLVSNSTFRNLPVGLWAQGRDGTFGNGEKERAVGVQFVNNHFDNVGAPVIIAGLNGVDAPDGDSDDAMTIVDGVTYENCGHNTRRLVGSDQQKSGVLNFLEAANCTVTNVRGRNDISYPNTTPGYPTDFVNRVGYGLSGHVGAMIWGQMRHVRISNFSHHGNVDDIIVMSRCRALGDDAAGQGGIIRNCYGLHFQGIEHHGTANHVIRLDDNASLRMASNELSGTMQVVVGALTVGICGAGMEEFTRLTLDVQERSSGKRVIGTPKQIMAAGNTFASFSTQLTDLRGSFEITLATNTAVAIPAPRDVGMLSIGNGVSASPASNIGGLFHYRMHVNAECDFIGGGTSLVAATGVQVSDATGTADRITVSPHTDGNVYIKNRFAGSRTLSLRFL